MTRRMRRSRGDGGHSGARRAGTPRAAALDVGELAGQVRLQKLLARAGVSSRRGGEALIVAGRVKVNGAVVTELGTKVNPACDRVSVDHRLIEAEPPLYLVVNKPDGVTCSDARPGDERDGIRLKSLLRGIDARVFPVGRLDFHARGVLLVTNDGELASRLLHPRYRVPSTYHAKFQGRLAPEVLDKLKAGVELEDGTVTRPVEELLVFRDTEANTWVQLTITQALHRQIRRMGEAIGHPVLKLIRVAFAEITADDVAQGQFRRLRESELGELRARVGLQNPSGGL